MAISSGSPEASIVTAIWKGVRMSILALRWCHSAPCRLLGLSVVTAGGARLPWCVEPTGGWRFILRHGGVTGAAAHVPDFAGKPWCFGRVQEIANFSSVPV